MDKYLLSLILLFSLLIGQAQQVVPEKDFLLGKFDYRTAQNFVKVDKKHSIKTVFLNEVVYDMFKEMHRQAKQEGIDLRIISGTRNFMEQKAIWEKKWKTLDSLSAREKSNIILEFTSMPSTSRHHWGTDLDLNSLQNSYFEEGRGKAEYEWLVKNAGKFGFYQVYTAQNTGRTGHREEKWHWSYIPLAAKYLQQYNQLISYCEISGFEGSELAEETGMISNYVNGIPPHLHRALPLKILPKGIVLLYGKK